MSTLLVDIGNTRVKWALVRGARLSRMSALVHDGDAAAMRALVRRAPRGVRRIIAVNVAGVRFERALAAPRRRASECETRVHPQCARGARRAQWLSRRVASRSGPLGGRDRRARARARQGGRLSPTSAPR